MALQYLLAPTFQFINTAGKPLSGGAYMEVYVHGTRTKYFCASDFDGTLHPFRIPLDSLGSNIVLANDTGSYDVYAYNRYGTLMMSRYNVKPGAGGGIGGTITSQDGSVKITPTADGVDLSVPEQQQSDWNEFRTDRPSYIRNKPNLLLKADRVSGAVPGNLAGLDANGNLVDSGKSYSDLEGTFKTRQTAKVSPTASGNTLSFIDTVSQDENGEITATKKTVTVDSTYSSAGTNPVNGKAVAAAIGGLDVSSVGGDGKYISAISETDGKISATATTMDTTPTENSKKAVTSGGIKAALNGKYTKPSTGIPKTDLASDVQTSLGKADTALQSHQAVSDNNPTLAWNTTSTVGTIGGTDLHVTMPEDAGNWSLASGNGRYMKFVSTENPGSGEMRTIDLAVANNVVGMLGLVRIDVSQNQSAVTPTVLGANNDFVTMFSTTTKPKILTFKDSSGRFTYVLDSGSHYNTSANYVFYVIGGNAGKWTFFGNTNAVGDPADLNAGTHQSNLDATFVFDVTAKKSLAADTATNADRAANADNADYASTAGSAYSVPWSGVDGKPSIPTKDSDVTNDRYVRFDANNQE